MKSCSKLLPNNVRFGISSMMASKATNMKQKKTNRGFSTATYEEKWKKRPMERNMTWKITQNAIPSYELIKDSIFLIDINLGEIHNFLSNFRMIVNQLISNFFLLINYSDWSKVKLKPEQWNLYENSLKYTLFPWSKKKLIWIEELYKRRKMFNFYLKKNSPHICAECVKELRLDVDLTMI